LLLAAYRDKKVVGVFVRFRATSMKRDVSRSIDSRALVCSATRKVSVTAPFQIEEA
jgi:hypothetical protein